MFIQTDMARVINAFFVYCKDKIPFDPMDNGYKSEAQTSPHNNFEKKRKNCVLKLKELEDLDESSRTQPLGWRLSLSWLALLSLTHLRKQTFIRIKPNIATGIKTDHMYHIYA